MDLKSDSFDFIEFEKGNEKLELFEIIALNFKYIIQNALIILGMRLFFLNLRSLFNLNDSKRSLFSICTQFCGT